MNILSPVTGKLEEDSSFHWLSATPTDGTEPCPLCDSSDMLETKWHYGCTNCGASFIKRMKLEDLL